MKIIQRETNIATIKKTVHIAKDRGKGRRKRRRRSSGGMEAKSEAKIENVKQYGNSR